MPNIALVTTRPDADALVVGVFEGEETSAGDWPGLGPAIDQGFRARPGERLVIYPEHPRRVVVVGLGRRNRADGRTVRRAAAIGVRAASGKGIQHIAVEIPCPDEYVPALLQGVGDGLYRFRAYKSGEDEASVEAKASVVLSTAADTVDVETALAADLVRDWVNLGANDKPPETLAAKMSEALGGLGVTVEILHHDQLRAMGAGGILAVGQGSDSPPAMLLASWRGVPGDPRTLALVGKGITFDSGGLSLKTGEGMMTMKGDMAGAAAVMGAVRALAKSRAPANVIGIACLAENMPGGHAQRPGDVIHTLGGKTVEVLNTDAEGRLVLADGVALAVQRHVDAIVDIATLTGANAMAFGGVFAGYLTEDARLKAALEEAGRRTGEPVWQLPIDDAYRDLLKSPIADIKNIGGRGGGMQTGGLFIGAFAGETPWMHVDIAGVSFNNEAKDGRAQGATAFGTALLAHLALSYFQAR
jgi:leucyl aminopeptidase